MILMHVTLYGLFLVDKGVGLVVCLIIICSTSVAASMHVTFGQRNG